MKKNIFTEVKPEFTIRKAGNWNYKDSNAPKVYSKPMGVVTIDGIEYLFKHSELLDLIKFYLEVDEESIDMITNPEVDTGLITRAEKPLIEKLRQFLKRY